MPEVIDHQQSIDLQTSSYEAFIEAAISLIPESEGKFPEVAFVSDNEMFALNLAFRGKSATTDVLSFPHDNETFEDNGELGELIVSVDQAAKQASENGLELETEIKQLLLHGILHLCGMDHDSDDGEMNEREMSLRASLEIG
jgi:probable rRNA maturation factor